MKKKITIMGVIRDVFVYALVIAGIGAFCYFYLQKIDVSNFKDTFFSFLGDIVIFLLGLIGIFEFCYDNNLLMFVPSTFINHKEKSQREQIERTLDKYLSEESIAYKEYQFEKIDYILSHLGLSQQGYTDLKMKLLQARLMPESNDIVTLRNKLTDIIYHGNVIIDLMDTPSYRADLRYYLKFSDLMHDKLMEEQLCSIMANFIYMTAGNSITDVTAIVIPHSSNYLLGLGVARKMGKQFVRVIPPEKVVGNICWEGNLSTSSKEQHIIIVHDVLLTSKQVYESISVLPSNCIVDGIYCFVYREGHGGKEKLHDLGFDNVYALLELTEDDITESLKQYQ